MVAKTKKAPDAGRRTGEGNRTGTDVITCFSNYTPGPKKAQSEVEYIPLPDMYYFDPIPTDAIIAELVRRGVL